MRIQSVSIEYCKSNYFLGNTGFPQGTLLAPILLSLCINDLFFIEINNNVIDFADESKLYGEVTPANSLQTDHTLIGSWFPDNKFKVNYEK